MAKQRKRVTGIRTTPCQFCEYPITQRHHALSFANFGENPFTLQLCANCHEFYHLVEAFVEAPTTHCKNTLSAWIRVYGFEDKRFLMAIHYINAVKLMKVEFGKSKPDMQSVIDKLREGNNES